MFLGVWADLIKKIVKLGNNVFVAIKIGFQRRWDAFNVAIGRSKN